MDLTKIESLIGLLHDSGLSALELTEGDDTIRLERHVQHASLPDAPAKAAAPAAIRAATIGTTTIGAATVAAPPGDLIRAPMQGILHLTPSPDEAPFVKLGDTVQPEQVICVIEAMKMFNTVEADVGGRIVEILATPGNEVKAGQALFRIA